MSSPAHGCALRWRPRVIQHIDPVAINTRYYAPRCPKGSVYSNLLRHKWREQGIKPNRESKGIYRKDFSMNWRTLIHKIWEVDPLICIKCGTEMPKVPVRVELKFLVDEESAKWELKRLRKMKYYYLGRWSSHLKSGWFHATIATGCGDISLPPPFINAA